MVTHGLTMNGRVHGEIKDPVLAPREIIEQRLRLLDGVLRYSLSIWRLPNDVPFDRIDLGAWPQEYIQAAGSAERMTLEVRRMDGAEPEQFVVGRQGASKADHGAGAAVRWGDFEAQVNWSEVFTAAEAADVFVSYYETDRVPDGIHLRPIGF
ncbi:hypothetical protein NBCG_05085 [Nocardioidaceae bacterium Broad-1]|nr:hypothetical protein NBCG_05085 [Nocardioidaceae bacterium Broad-1]